jgi:hypothetical protein
MRRAAAVVGRTEAPSAERIKVVVVLMGKDECCSCPGAGTYGGQVLRYHRRLVRCIPRGNSLRQALTQGSCLASNGCQDSCTNGTGSPPASSSSPSPTPAAHSSLSKGEILGIAFGSVGAVIILVGLVFTYRKMQNRHEITMQNGGIQLEQERSRSTILRIMETPGGLASLERIGVDRQIGNRSPPRLLGGVDRGGGRFGGGSIGQVLDP